MTPKDLKTGMFGVNRIGQFFMVMNDKLIYQDDGFEWIHNFNDAFELGNRKMRDYDIIGILKANCFEDAKYCWNKKINILWQRENPSDKITITRKQFDDAIAQVAEKWDKDATVEDSSDAMFILTMYAHNLEIGKQIRDVLFGTANK